MKIHVICPFHNITILPTLIYYLDPMKIEWYPVIEPNENTQFNKKWIHPLLVKPLQPGEQCYRKINDFIDTQYIVDEDYYCFMCDDDMYEPGFFNVIRQQTADIIFCSMYRGDIQIGQHPAKILYINTILDIRVNKIGLEQIIVKGKVFKNHKFNYKYSGGDGQYAELLKTLYPNCIKILPNLFAFFNYFQPGRYTNKTKLLKSNWELPKYYEKV